ncbi:F-box protein CPR1-like [Cicer arietinum]|uniref:F-box protein CPR1-like n=1 Tax=Cicer arietinum TaxID=3827 RepID=A0A1S2Y310_CICAR|nr:F-box protein CPR1-like [Cicer arietinum]
MALLSEKVSNYISDDLVFSILSKLSLKSLNRFTCVRKSWVLLFENPHFMSMYRKNFISNNRSYYYDDTSLLLKQTLLDFENHSMLYLLSGEKFDNRIKLDWPPPFQDNDRHINILGSGINGILCLYVEGTSSKVVVWNPSIQEFKIIPPSPVLSVPPYVNVVLKLHGFGYDSVRDDYKIIRYVDFFPDPYNFKYDSRNVISSKRPYKYKPLWEIYSLKSNSWRKLDLDMTIFCHYLSRRGVQHKVYLNGVCHWLGNTETNMDNICLISFDLSNEVFFRTFIPSITDDGINLELVNYHLGLLNKSIALIFNIIQTQTFHISVLGEIGVEESWTKLFIVGPLPYLGHPIGIGKSRNIFFIKENDELVWCDLSTNTIQETGMKGNLFFCQIVNYNL